MAVAAEPSPIRQAEIKPLIPHELKGPAHFQINPLNGLIEGADMRAKVFLHVPFGKLQTPIHTLQDVLTSPQLRTGFAEHYKALLTAEAGNGEEVMVLETGTGQFIQVRTQVVRDAKRNPLLFDTQCEDVTEAVKRGEKLKQPAIDKAEAAKELAKASANGIAHDIRAALTTGKGYTVMTEMIIRELMEQKGTMDEGALKKLQTALDYLERVEHSVDKGGAIAQDYLDLMMATPDNYTPEDVDLLNIMEALSKGDFTLKNGRPEAKVTIQPLIGHVVGNGQWIERVLDNLISNAIKYGGDNPSVNVGVASLDDGSYKFFVTDNGPGISSEDQKRLFQEFSRLARHKSLPGTGLGLSLVKRMVEIQGGTVGVESEEGKGSTFFFTLQEAPANSTPLGDTLRSV